MTIKKQVPLLVKYNKLLIFKEVEPIGKNRMVQVKCDCGNIKIVRYQNVKSGYIKTCGCGQSRITHGLSRNKIYKIYGLMKHRCLNINNKYYNRYGGRGIECHWNSFEEFYNDMGDTYEEGLTIDRVNNDGHYNKENCRWTTIKEQNRNRSDNIIYKGKCIGWWIEDLGLVKNKVYWRIRHNWTIEEALELI